ncbi:hypothetical protein PGQ11_000987 [Apiospora arundinis]
MTSSTTPSEAECLFLFPVLTIFSFFAVCLRKAGSQWCLHGWADDLSGKCYTLFGEEHRSWI